MYNVFQVLKVFFIKSFKDRATPILLFLVILHQHQQISFFTIFQNFIQPYKKDFHHKFCFLNRFTQQTLLGAPLTPPFFVSASLLNYMRQLQGVAFKRASIHQKMLGPVSLLQALVSVLLAPSYCWTLLLYIFEVQLCLIMCPLYILSYEHQILIDRPVQLFFFFFYIKMI